MTCASNLRFYNSLFTSVMTAQSEELQETFQNLDMAGATSNSEIQLVSGWGHSSSIPVLFQQTNMQSVHWWLRDAAAMAWEPWLLKLADSIRLRINFPQLCSFSRPTLYGIVLIKHDLQLFSVPVEALILIADGK